ncbi:restriction endonuclease subunit S [Acinetobacter baumannii]|uniref:restriction endonuclease subunit S n=1 Tax=Acinetobacter baumannii TaxID=470 RepID=UPI00081988F9|nr:restriction endonuclease subunit S [Acinetobacter baumannii]MDA5693433.1 restriction endonuclease subunit S [Acinetobacter baumannii]MDC4379797.1 restriction endonuclease subunit S [Acinetobacter baumannii]SCD15082.1 EcoKI restriction-modification system protein HsdS [Acinetobacter baumannii]
MSFPKIRLDQVCRITMGQAPSGDSYNFDGNGLALIAGAGDFGKETPEPKKYTTAAGKKSETGEIILCIRATIGDLNWSDKEYCLGRGVAGLFGHKDKLDQKYLWHWLKNVAPLLKSKGKGATFLQVTKEDICSLEIALPPLAEQRRIASILDKADELRQKRQQAIKKLDQLLQATFIDMFGDPVSNPKGFAISKLSEQVNLIQIGPFGTQLHQEDYIENGIPLINPSHIKNGKIIPNYKLTVGKTKYKELAQYHLQINDVLLGRRGEMGRCAVVTKKEVGWLCGTGSLFLRPKINKINPFFLELLLSSDSIKRYLENVSQGQTMANLNKTIVGSIPLIIPSIELQNKFFLISEKIDKMKNELENAKNQINNLFESLQNKAFSGTL